VELSGDNLKITDLFLKLNSGSIFVLRILLKLSTISFSSHSSLIKLISQELEKYKIFFLLSQINKSSKKAL